MVGLIMGAVGAAAGLAASLIPDKEITTEYKTYTPDPMSVRNAGLYNTSVDLNESSYTENTTETPGIKKGLMIGASLLGAGAGLAGGLGGKKDGAISPMQSTNISGGVAKDPSIQIQQREMTYPNIGIPEEYRYGRKNKGI